MDIRKQFRNKLLLVYLASSFLALITSGILLRDQWSDTINDAGMLAVKDLEIVSGTTKQILLNCTKLLDVTKRELQQAVATNQYDPKSIIKIISNSASVFSIDNEVKNYGLLTANDKNGILIARSDGFPTKSINFSDRYYFKELKNDPSKHLSVGPLLLARTTGKRVFSIAVPIKDTQGRFNGTLALQVSEDSITKLIKAQIGESGENITAITNDNEIVFTTISDQIYPDSNSMVKFSDVFGGINLGPESKWWLDKGIIVASKFDPKFQINYISTQFLEKLFSNFLKSNIKIFGLAVICQLIFTYLMWLIYRQFLRAELDRKSSLTDKLTQLPNRRAFDEHYEMLLKNAQRNRTNISILFIDIDKFKFCNDEYGHENGDLVLKALANILKSLMRRPLDFCCRWGGEELVALLPDTSETGATKVAEQILDAVRNASIQINGYPPIHITVSIGIAFADYQKNSSLENNLVDRADQAMYRAKQGGRDRYSL